MRRPAASLVGALFVGLAASGCSSAADATAPGQAQKNCGTRFHPGHYGLVPGGSSVAREIPRIAGSSFLGLQRRYEWRDLEVAEGRYDFSPIARDLTALGEAGLRLVVQLQDKAFHGVPAVPDYLLTDPRYDGGVFYVDGGGSVVMPLLWNDEVLNRELALLDALAARFDTAAYLEAINFPETAFPRDSAGATGYDDQRYFDALVSRIRHARTVFQHTVVIQYANWLNGPAIGSAEQALGSLADQIERAGGGWGGPDLVPTSLPGNIPIPAYPFYSLHAGRMPLGAAVQEPEMGGRLGTFTAEELYRFGVDDLQLNYMFWVMVDGTPTNPKPPGFTAGVLPYVNSKGGRIANTTCPANIRPCAPCGE